MNKLSLVFTLFTSFSALASTLTVKQLLTKKNPTPKAEQVKLTPPTTKAADRPMLQQGSKSAQNLGSYPL